MERLKGLDGDGSKEGMWNLMVIAQDEGVEKLFCCDEEKCFDHGKNKIIWYIKENELFWNGTSLLVWSSMFVWSFSWCEETVALIGSDFQQERIDGLNHGKRIWNPL